MTNRENFFAAVENKPVERVPAGFWFHFLEESEMDQGLHNPALIQRNIEGHQAYFKAFHPDFVKIMSDGYFVYPIGFGETYQTPEDLEKITVISQEHPWIKQQAKLVKAVTSAQADTAYFYNFFSPVANLQWIVGDAFFALIKQDAKAVTAALNRIAEGLAVLAKEIIQAGADGIYLSVNNPDPQQISDEQYRDIITPSEKLLLEHVHQFSLYHILHICGFQGKRNHLPLYQDYDTKIVNWAVNVENISLSEGKKLFGGRAVIGGYANSPGELIHKGSKAEIQAFAQKLLAEAGTQGVILGADCTVPSDISLEHLEWVRQAAAEYTANQ